MTPQSDTSTAPARGEVPDGRPLGWRTLLATLAFYVVCLTAATWPLARNFRTQLVGNLHDPLQHLWLLNWYKACLLEGRLSIICPEVQYPTGMPMGNISPMPLAGLLFVPLSLLLRDDLLSFNLVWLSAMLLAGLGTFALIWQVLRHRGAAAFGGMLAMLSGPMLLHARGHLEIIQLGTVPLFLAAWLRFFDRPSRGRLVAAAGLYVLVAASAAYYAVLVVVPAALYVAVQAGGAWRGGERGYLRARLLWLLGFAAAVVPPALLLFGNQLWALAQGHIPPQPWEHFVGFGTSLWTYVIPTQLHRLSALMPTDIYFHTGYGGPVAEKGSYLGVVSLLLISYALMRRVAFPRSRYFWAALALLAVLSCGAYWHIGPYRASLPAAWLKKNFFLFKLIRVPARFNLIAVAVAAVIAAAGLRDLLGRLPGRRRRAAAFGLLATVAVLDLSTVPFPSGALPDLPPAYARLKRRDPQATLLEFPQFDTSGCRLTCHCTYWQAKHRMPTSMGYSSHLNVPYYDLITVSSPFLAGRLHDPAYLRGKGSEQFGIVANADFEGYAWLYLTAHRFHYLVLHQWPDSTPEIPVYVDAIKARLEHAKIDEDGTLAVYDRDRLDTPSRPALLCTRGWRYSGVQPPFSGFVKGEGVFAAYNPDPDRELRFAFVAKAPPGPCTARLLSGGRELARWVVPPDRFEPCVSGPFRLPAGLQELTLACDAEEAGRRDGPPTPSARAPFRMRVSTVSLDFASPTPGGPNRILAFPQQPDIERR
jgi:hypothetical protein